MVSLERFLKNIHGGRVTDISRKTVPVFESHDRERAITEGFEVCHWNDKLAFITRSK